MVVNEGKVRPEGRQREQYGVEAWRRDRERGRGLGKERGRGIN